MQRYSIIHEKNPREILLLRGFGCRYRKCAFCDYHTDYSFDEEENFTLNREVLAQVTGQYHHLEVINSGSFTELGNKTLEALLLKCQEKQIHTLHFECHPLFRDEIAPWRKAFAAVGTTLKIKTGVETFDYDFRENILHKGILEKEPAKIAEGFDECCLLFGLTWQTANSMINDIETGLLYFERVCINIFIANRTKVKPDPEVIAVFKQEVMPRYIHDPRVDILLNNTDFGVGN